MHVTCVLCSVLHVHALCDECLLTLTQFEPFVWVFEGLGQHCADDGSWRLWLQVTVSCSQQLTPPPCGDWESSCLMGSAPPQVKWEINTGVGAQITKC